jgi:integrase
MLNKQISNFLKQQNQPIELTTHSFRHHFITELWKDSGDIEFVRQFMGHQKVESTVGYIQNIGDSEKIVKLHEVDQKKKDRVLMLQQQKQSFQRTDHIWNNSGSEDVYD